MGYNDNVYFFRFGRSGPIKIGVSQDVGQRLKIIQPHLPKRLVVMGILKPANYSKRKYQSALSEEACLHEKFNKERLIHEWFRPSKRLVTFIKTNCRDVTSKDLGLDKRKPKRRGYGVKMEEYLN